MQFVDMYGAVKDEVGLSTNQTAFAKRMVNTAAHRFYTARLWSFLRATKDITLVSSQQDYKIGGNSAVLTDYASIISVQCNQGTSGSSANQFPDLVEFDQQLFARVFGRSTETGTPVAYTVRGGTPATAPGTTLAGGVVNLSFFLIPNAALTARVSYFRAGDSVEMSSDTDTPLCPVRWQYLIVDLAQALALEREGGDALGQAETLRKSYEAGLAQAMAEDIAATGTDDEQLERRQVARLQPVVPQSAASFDPASRPYPKAAA